MTRFELIRQLNDTDLTKWLATNASKILVKAKAGELVDSEPSMLFDWLNSESTN